MPNVILDDLRAQVAKNTEVNASATLLINGIVARIQAAVDKALSNGATAAELEPLTAEVAALKASATALGDAVVANTPQAPTPTEPPAVEPDPGLGGGAIGPDGRPKVTQTAENRLRQNQPQQSGRTPTQAARAADTNPRVGL